MYHNECVKNGMLYVCDSQPIHWPVSRRDNDSNNGNYQFSYFNAWIITESSVFNSIAQFSRWANNFCCSSVGLVIIVLSFSNRFTVNSQSWNPQQNVKPKRKELMLYISNFHWNMVFFSLLTTPGTICTHKLEAQLWPVISWRPCIRWWLNVICLNNVNIYAQCSMLIYQNNNGLVFVYFVSNALCPYEVYTRSGTFWGRRPQRTYIYMYICQTIDCRDHFSAAMPMNEWICFWFFGIFPISTGDRRFQKGNSPFFIRFVIAIDKLHFKNVICLVFGSFLVWQRRKKAINGLHAYSLLRLIDSNELDVWC